MRSSDLVLNALKVGKGHTKDHNYMITLAGRDFNIQELLSTERFLNDFNAALSEQVEINTTNRLYASVGCTKHGQKYLDEYGDSYILWAVFPGTMSEEEVETALDKLGWDADGISCSHSYDCCANWYYGGYWLRGTDTRWLATWAHYRNV